MRTDPPDDVPVPVFGPCIVCTKCGIVVRDRWRRREAADAVIHPGGGRLRFRWRRPHVCFLGRGVLNCGRHPHASAALCGAMTEGLPNMTHGIDVDNQVLALRRLAKAPLAELSETMVHRALLVAADMIETLGAEAAAAAWKEEQERRRASLL